MNVLVVDDDEMTRGLIARFVSRAGHHVIGEAEDGVAALEMLENVAPDVIITDCQMPRLNGIAMVKRLRESGRETRVVMLSGQTDHAVIEVALQAGVDEYLMEARCRSFEIDFEVLGAGAMKPAACWKFYSSRARRSQRLTSSRRFIGSVERIVRVHHT